MPIIVNKIILILFTLGKLLTHYGFEGPLVQLSDFTMGTTRRQKWSGSIKQLPIFEYDGVELFVPCQSP